jgi:uncharacterized repeat protein (TIGR04138 family)
MRHTAIVDIIKRDPRYAYEAYEFTFAALHHTQKLLGKAPKSPEAESAQHHVSGTQLLEGVRDLAMKEFGLMARSVFRCWGIEKSGDFGDIVFNLIEANLMSKTREDSREDFDGGFDLDRALTQDYKINLEELDQA